MLCVVLDVSFGEQVNLLNDKYTAVAFFRPYTPGMRRVERAPPLVLALMEEACFHGTVWFSRTWEPCPALAPRQPVHVDTNLVPVHMPC